MTLIGWQGSVLIFTDRILTDIDVCIPNGAKTQLLMHTNTNLLLDLCILLGLFDRAYQLMA